MSEQLLVAIVLLSPVIGFFINGFRYKSGNYLLSGSVATLASAISFIGALLLYSKLLALPSEARAISVHYFDWISVGTFIARARFQVDVVSIIMLLIITGVGTLIHLFSVGYMSHDERPTKYFAYLNLFLFNMLMLVLGDNLLIMFIGWEGVGLCSYLLIGFWFKDPAKAAAGMKAFVTNRIGDAGLLLGIFILFQTLGTITFGEMAAALPTTPELGWTGPITIACLLLFLGATGKSAQIPLYVWLPDAMAGPTPVSALIHAATMVTAGVYMIIRMNGVFLMAPNALHVVAVVGAATALMAAIIGLTQNDIKKVLAYSTVSQLGYMFLGVGVGAFIPALFHLMTHAFFKALMFLGSGSVIHAMHEEQDIRKMGGLRKKLPITHFTFLMGWLAIIGIPPFAGFFSKDEILWFSFSSHLGHPLLWLVGAVTALCTAFYMTRLMALTFWGKSRVPKGTEPHESPLVMTLPLIVLAVLSVIGGWIGIPHVIGEILPGHPGNVFHHWLESIVSTPELTTESKIAEWSLMGISVALAGIGAWMAFQFYVIKTDIPNRIAAAIAPVHKFVDNKYFVDEFYFKYIINPIVDGSKALWVYFDVKFIDRITFWLSDLIDNSGQGLQRVQSGNLQTYALYIALGFIGAMAFILMG